MATIPSSALIAAYEKFEYIVMWDLVFLGLKNYWIDITIDGQTLFKKKVTRKRIHNKIRYKGIILHKTEHDPRSLQEAIRDDITNAAYEQFVLAGLLAFDVRIYDKKGTIYDFGINVPSPDDIVYPM